MKKQVFKIGEKVKIINPEFFIRCGYNLTIQDGLNMITPEERQVILKMLDKKSQFNYSYHGGDKIFDKILNEIAYSKIRGMGFGGKERKIFTKRIENLTNGTGTIISKKTVKTGKYESGYVSGWETPEYNPPFLGNEKTHIILSLDLVENPDEIYLDALRIEEKNVEKI